MAHHESTQDSSNASDAHQRAIEEALTRSVDSIYPSKDALAKLMATGKPLRIYVGIDPTAEYVHLGHATNYLLLKRLHALGHKIIVLVGDFTAMIGDPSDKTTARQQLTREDVERNLATFKDQIGKILDFADTKNPIEFAFNSKWLAKLNFSDVVDLASNFTVQQMIERDTFQQRLAAQKPLYVHEFFYPLMQGYDSVMLEADIEIGGTDQTFNMLAGRTLVKRYQDREKFVITTTLLENPVTGEKLMSKSLGTGIGLNEAPTEMYAKVMALADETIIRCFVDCTELPLDDIHILEQALVNGENPRNVKMSLARAIVGMYHSDDAAHEAEQQWVAQVSNKELPSDIEEHAVTTGSDIVTILTETGLVASKSEARRLVAQQGVKLNDEVVTAEAPLDITDGAIVQVGKRRFAKLRLKG